MGQVINVKVLEGPDPDVRHFEMDRGLTGMGFRAYRDPDDATTDKPDDLLARRILAIDGVETAFVYGSVVSVSRAEGVDWSDLVPAIENEIRNLFVYYDVNRV